MSKRSRWVCQRCGRRFWILNEERSRTPLRCPHCGCMAVVEDPCRPPASGIRTEEEALRYVGAK